MRPELETQLLNCRNLPSPPGVALRIIELAQDPDVVMATAADTIGLDAALSARMLRIANSPLYASRRRVENLSQALTVLGLNATLTLALGFGPPAGYVFTIVSGLGSAASGTFVGMPDGTWMTNSFGGNDYILEISYNDVAVDPNNDITLTVIPEPAAFGLIGLGVVLFLARRRRR